MSIEVCCNAKITYIDEFYRNKADGIQLIASFLSYPNRFASRTGTGFPAMPHCAPSGGPITPPPNWLYNDAR